MTVALIKRVFGREGIGYFAGSHGDSEHEVVSPIFGLVHRARSGKSERRCYAITLARIGHISPLRRADRTLQIWTTASKKTINKQI